MSSNGKRARLIDSICQGLGDHTDITVKGLDIVRRAKRAYLENYTSIYCQDNVEDLERFYGRPLIVADREMVEMNADSILEGADTEDVAFLVLGDPLGATTHADLILRAKERNISHRLIHNASIINACGCCGLQLYRFGEVVSIPLWTDSWKPTSFLDKICSNLQNGLHTLCLLDIKVKEQSVEAMMKGKKEYLPPTFMSAGLAARQLLETIEIYRTNLDDPESMSKPIPLTPDTECVGLARVGHDTQQIRHATLSQMANIDLGPPLHSLIVIGDLHTIEAQMLRLFKE